jgi:PBSX family phage terminase large subunit
MNGKSSISLVPLSDKQEEAIDRAEQHINIYDGAVRAGKTLSSELRWLYDVKRLPPGPLLMVGKTERTLKFNVLDRLVELIPKGIKLATGSGECTIFGRRVYLVGANDERAELKIRGITLVGAYGDQVETWPETFFNMLMSRLTLPEAKMLGTCNPQSPRHWLKMNWLDREGEIDLLRVHFVLDDNPSLSKRTKENLRKEFSGLWHKRYIEGLWVAGEGAIYEMFDEDRHIVGKLNCPIRHLPRMTSWWLGLDYGTAAPFVICLMGEGADGNLYVLDEWRWDSAKTYRQKTDREYSEDARIWLRQKGLWDKDEGRWSFERFEVPSDAASLRVQLWEDGFRTSQAFTDVKIGIRVISSLLHADRLFFAPNMEDSEGIGELMGYVWDDKARLLGEDKPLKVNDHFPDALRYTVMGARDVWKRWLQLPEVPEEEQETG